LTVCFPLGTIDIDGEGGWTKKTRYRFYDINQQYYITVLLLYKLVFPIYFHVSSLLTVLTTNHPVCPSVLIGPPIVLSISPVCSCLHLLLLSHLLFHCQSCVFNGSKSCPQSHQLTSLGSLNEQKLF
jgi:hypothetical protein